MRLQLSLLALLSLLACASAKTITLEGDDYIGLDINSTASFMSGPDLSNHAFGSDTAFLNKTCTVEDVNVMIQLTTPWPADVHVGIKHAHKIVRLFGDLGANVPVYKLPITFDDDADTSILKFENVEYDYSDYYYIFRRSLSAVPESLLPGTYRPHKPLSKFNGLDGYGEWELIVVDDYASLDDTIIDHWHVEVQCEGDESVTKLEGNFFTVPKNATALDVHTPEWYPEVEKSKVYLNQTCSSVKNVTVAFELTSEWPDDSELSLKHSGTTVKLMHDIGGWWALNQTVLAFNDAYTPSINTFENGVDYFTYDDDMVESGRYAPMDALAAFEGGLGSGVWQLVVSDDFFGMPTVVTDWELTVDCGSDGEYTLTPNDPDVSMADPIIVDGKPEEGPEYSYDIFSYFPQYYQDDVLELAMGLDRNEVYSFDNCTIVDTTVHLVFKAYYMSDVKISVRHGGEHVKLFWDSSFSADVDPLEVWFNDYAPISWAENYYDAPLVPQDGWYQPMQSLSVFEGMDAQGKWQVEFADGYDYNDPAILEWFEFIITCEGNQTVNLHPNGFTWEPIVVDGHGTLAMFHSPPGPPIYGSPPPVYGFAAPPGPPPSFEALVEIDNVFLNYTCPDVTKVSVSLYLTSTFPDDVELALVHGGEMAHIMRDTGGATDVDSLSLTFMDDALMHITHFKGILDGAYGDHPLESGVFKPETPFDVFEGIDGYGEWSLVVVDDYPGYDTVIVEDWTLTVCCGPCDVPKGSGDPHFVGFDGSAFDYGGRPGSFFNILSAKHVQINGLLAPELTHGLTYMTTIGMLTAHGDRIKVSVVEGASVVAVNDVVPDLAQQFETANGVVLSINADGDVIASAGGMRVTLHVHKGMFLDITNIEIVGAIPRMHGVLGNTANVRSNPGLEGQEADYEVSDLWSSDFKYNLFQVEDAAHAIVDHKVMGAALTEAINTV